MNEEAILELYNELSTDYEVGDINQFKAYLQDPEYRVDFFEQVIKPIYEVEDIADFEAFYGLKKKGEKDGASPSGAGFRFYQKERRILFLKGQLVKTL